MPVKPIPDGYPSVISYLIVDDPARLLDFLSQAFGARETERITRPDGTIGHAQARIGDSVIMMGGARGDWRAMPGSIYIYVTMPVTGVRWMRRDIVDGARRSVLRRS